MLKFQNWSLSWVVMATANSVPPRSHSEHIACIGAPTAKVSCYRRRCPGLFWVGSYQSAVAHFEWMSGGSVSTFEAIDSQNWVLLTFLCRLWESRWLFCVLGAWWGRPARCWTRVWRCFVVGQILDGSFKGSVGEVSAFLTGFIFSFYLWCLNCHFDFSNEKAWKF